MELCVTFSATFAVHAVAISPMTPPRGKPPAMKALAMLHYAMGKVSFCSIARILGVSDVAVLNWVRDEARKLPEPQKPQFSSLSLARTLGVFSTIEAYRPRYSGDLQYRQRLFRPILRPDKLRHRRRILRQVG